MASRELVDKVFEIIKYYRANGSFQMTIDRVESWADQYGSDVDFIALR